ncbi:MAG: DNA-binding response OmpR family regulator [Oleispira sp.]|jgi:DNA-binding response OmpR family regulator
MLVLLVEDEVPLAKLVCEYLEDEGFETDHAVKASQAIQLLDKHDFDVLILDINLPDMSGFEMCKHIRQRGINIPTIMLTARHSLEDKEQGFLAGTDDYLIKPFAMQELVMRIKALNQRANRSDKIRLGKLQLEVSQHKALIAEKEISLTPDEWRLLLLLSRENKTVTREKILTQLWPDDSGSDDGLKMLLFRLRKTISQTLKAAQLADNTLQVKTIRGIGLRLEYSE